MSITSNSIQESFAAQDNIEFVDDSCVVVTAEEQSQPALVRESWRIHAESYHNEGFVSRDAIDEDGFLELGLDKSRERSSNEYLLALDPEDPRHAATMRKVHLGDGESYTELPTHQMCEDLLSAEGAALLELGYESQEHDLIEISALARTANCNPVLLHKLIRSSIMRASGNGEIWVMSLVKRTHTALVDRMGPSNFRQIGEEFKIPDERVSRDVVLVPAVLEPDHFMTRLNRDYLAAPEGSKQKARLRQGLEFYSEAQEIITPREQITSNNGVGNV